MKHQTGLMQEMTLFCSGDADWKTCWGVSIIYFKDSAKKQNPYPQFQEQAVTLLFRILEKTSVLLEVGGMVWVLF